jgi:hypothetical protein
MKEDSPQTIVLSFIEALKEIIGNLGNIPI